MSKFIDVLIGGYVVCFEMYFSDVFVVVLDKVKEDFGVDVVGVFVDMVYDVKVIGDDVVIGCDFEIVLVYVCVEIFIVQCVVEEKLQYMCVEGMQVVFCGVQGVIVVYGSVFGSGYGYYVVGGMVLFDGWDLEI